MIIVFSHILNKFLFIFIGLSGLSLLIAIHELGHFLLCKLFNVYTPSFSIGFGPVILEKKIGETNFKLSAIPLGGYVEIAQAEEQNIPNNNNEIYFATISWWKKLAIMLGGISFNLLFAYLILAGLAVVGERSILYKNYSSCSIESIKEASEAFYKNLNADYSIETFNGFELDQTKPLLDQLAKSISLESNQTVMCKNNAEQNIEFLLDTPNLQAINSEKRVFFVFEKLSDFGITFKITQPIGFFSALFTGIKQTNNFIAATFLGLKSALIGSSSASLSGPIMIIAMSSKIVERGINQFLIFLALISINLAVMNLIPLPILDGGQILFLTIELALQRPLNTKVREYISLICWIGFMLLFAYLSWKDILKLTKLA